MSNYQFMPERRDWSNTFTINITIAMTFQLAFPLGQSAQAIISIRVLYDEFSAEYICVGIPIVSGLIKIA